MKAFTLLFLIIMVSACSARGPIYNETPDKDLAGQSQIVVYRNKQFAASGSCYRIKIDGELLGSLESGSYLKKTVSAGPHVVSVELGDGINLPITTAESTKNYVLLDMAIRDLSTFGVGTAQTVDLTWNIALIDAPNAIALPVLSKLNESSTCLFEAN